MEQWVRLCAVSEGPEVGGVMELQASGVAVCLVNVEGKLCAMDNWCPHRRGPLGEGWLDGKAVVCPWHSWAFDTASGEAVPPDRGRVDIYGIKIEGNDVLVNLG